jgi:carboxypeptidase C (cathepsin A)
MKRLQLNAIFICTGCIILHAQQKQAATPASNAAKEDKKEIPNLPNLEFNPDWNTSTDHEAIIKGQKVPYKATLGNMPVWDDDGKCIAGCFIPIMKELMLKTKH